MADILTLSMLAKFSCICDTQSVSFARSNRLFYYFFYLEIDHCNPNPCLHDGHCSEINGGLGFVCQCQLGYKGQNCESKLPLKLLHNENLNKYIMLDGYVLIY